eukprot:RCo013083
MPILRPDKDDPAGLLVGGGRKRGSRLRGKQRTRKEAAAGRKKFGALPTPVDDENDINQEIADDLGDDSFFVIPAQRQYGALPKGLTLEELLRRSDEYENAPAQKKPKPPKQAPKVMSKPKLVIDSGQQRGATHSGEIPKMNQKISFDD